MPFVRSLSAVRRDEWEVRIIPAGPRFPVVALVAATDDDEGESDDYEILPVYVDGSDQLQIAENYDQFRRENGDTLGSLTYCEFDQWWVKVSSGPDVVKPVIAFVVEDRESDRVLPVVKSDTGDLEILKSYEEILDGWNHGDKDAIPGN